MRQLSTALYGMVVAALLLFALATEADAGVTDGTPASCGQVSPCDEASSPLPGSDHSITTASDGQ